MKNTHLNGLLTKANKFLQNGLTRSTYRALQAEGDAWSSAKEQEKLVPASECTSVDTLHHIWLHIISFATIKVYVSAVHHMHLCKIITSSNNSHLVFNSFWEAIKRRQACTCPVRWRLPITIQMLHRIRMLLLKGAPDYTNTALLWCLAFFGFLRISESTELVRLLSSNPVFYNCLTNLYYLPKLYVNNWATHSQSFNLVSIYSLSLYTQV